VRARPFHVAPATSGGLDRQPAGQLTARWKLSPAGRPVASWSLQLARSLSATQNRTQTTQMERNREESLTSVARRFFWMALVAVVCWVGLLVGAGSALAETKTFAKQGCEKWEVPAGVSSVAMRATGAAGGPPENGSALPGKGDAYSALLSGLSPGEDLFVCVDEGGGAGGRVPSFSGGGPGGGASGLSRGANFESPVLVAAGGGGAGADSRESVGAGGNAGEAGKEGEGAGGGGAGTESEGGAGGSGSGSPSGKGTKFTGLGPGHGGAGGSGVNAAFGGGGGGGGYFGGGGGGGTDESAAGGGGGGSDFCGNGAGSCERHAEAGTNHEAGEAEGDAKVTLTFARTCGKTTVGKTPDNLVANQKRVNKCVLPVNAAISQLSEYLSPTTFKGQELIKGVIYADSAGKPAGLLAVTEQLTFKSTQAAGWYPLKFALPVPLTAGTYWIGVITGNTGKVAAEHYDKVANAEDYNTNTYTSGPSNPFGSFKTTSEEMSLYATFTPQSPKLAWSQGSTTITSYAYGTVPAGNTVTQTFKLTNSGGGGSESLSASLANSMGKAFSIKSDGCTGKVLAPGGSCEVEVADAPAANTESDEGTLEAGGAKLGLSGEGGLQALTLSATLTQPQEEFTEEPRGTNGAKKYTYGFGKFGSSQPFTITNEGAGTSEGLSMANLNSHFALANNKCEGAMLASGKSCTFEVTLNCPVGGGFVSSSLDVIGEGADAVEFIGVKVEAPCT
jgi:hypothetical protein